MVLSLKTEGLNKSFLSKASGILDFLQTSSCLKRSRPFKGWGKTTNFTSVSLKGFLNWLLIYSLYIKNIIPDYRTKLAFRQPVGRFLYH